MVLLVGGGTVSHVRTHFAICAPAYGGTVRRLSGMLGDRGVGSEMLLTRMAGGGRSSPETSEELELAIRRKLSSGVFSVCVMNAAVCDFDGSIGVVGSGRDAERLCSREGGETMMLTPSRKILAGLCGDYPDVAFMGFKTTTGASDEEMERLAARQMGEAGVEWTASNDTGNGRNMLFAKGPDGIGRLFSGDRTGLTFTIASVIAGRVRR